MLKIFGLALAASLAMFINPAQPQPLESASPKSVYDFTVKDIDGREFKLDQLRGKVVMIVNVASRCGYTPQYEGLQALYTKYKDRGFVVLGFPANNFKGQEPGTEAEIKEFCQTKFNVNFPLFSKVSVKGEDQHPLYKYLTEKETNPQFAGDITWNFNKFVVGKDGRVVSRFESKDKPDSETVVQSVEKALAAS